MLRVQAARPLRARLGAAVALHRNSAAQDNAAMSVRTRNRFEVAAPTAMRIHDVAEIDAEVRTLPACCSPASIYEYTHLVPRQ